MFGSATRLANLLHSRRVTADVQGFVGGRLLSHALSGHLARAVGGVGRISRVCLKIEPRQR